MSGSRCVGARSVGVDQATAPETEASQVLLDAAVFAAREAAWLAQVEGDGLGRMERQLVRRARPFAAAMVREVRQAELRDLMVRAVRPMLARPVRGRAPRRRVVASRVRSRAAGGGSGDDGPEPPAPLGAYLDKHALPCGVRA